MRLVRETAKWLLGIIAPIVITAWLTGQPLAGLVKLRGLYTIFIKSSVPAWSFALAFLLALFGIYYWFAHLPRRKGKVHFVPDAHNCGWSKQTDTDMNLRLGGTFTYDLSGERLVLLQAYLKGTRPVTDLTVQTDSPDGTSRTVTTSQLWLEGHTPERTFMHLHLKPVLGKLGKPLRRKLILRDKFNREFSVGPIDFPYIGPKA